MLLLLLLLRRAPRALERGPSERQHVLRVGREDSEWGRRTTKGVLPENIEVGASLQPVFQCLRLLLVQRARRVGCQIQWAYTLRGGVCPACGRAKRTGSALLEVAMQSAFQEKCSYTMAVRGLLGEDSVTARRMRAFAVENEMDPRIPC